MVINARNQDELEATAHELEGYSGVPVLPVAGDLTKPADVEKLVEKTLEAYGKIDVLVNNAGGIGAFGTFDSLSDDDWRDLFELNLFSVVRLTRAVLPQMQKQGWGRIVNISSESATQPDAAAAASIGELKA